MNNKIENKMVLFENTGNNPSNLNPNDILIAEFNYAMQTATQSNEDRVKIFQFIVANIITIAATIFVTSLTYNSSSKLFGLVFIFFVVLGMFSLVHLSRLRLAWVDSVKVMNRIKEYYIKNNPELEEAFLWKMSTIPSAKKRSSLAYQLALTVMFFNSVSLAIGTSLMLSLLPVPAIIIGIFGFIAQLVLGEVALKN